MAFSEHYCLPNHFWRNDYGYRSKALTVDYILEQQGSSDLCARPRVATSYLPLSHGNLELDE